VTLLAEPHASKVRRGIENPAIGVEKSDRLAGLKPSLAETREAQKEWGEGSEVRNPAEATSLRLVSQVEAVVNSTRQNKAELEDALFVMCDALQVAPPGGQFVDDFAHPEMLRFLSEFLFVPYSKELRERLSELQRGLRERDTNFIRVRGLGKSGIYPGRALSYRSAHYVIENQEPFFLTENSAIQEREQSGWSELSDWTRHETRLAAALSCAPYGGFRPHLTGRVIDIPITVLDHLDRPKRLRVATEFARLAKGANVMRGFHTGGPKPEVGDFEFGDFRQYEAEARAIASRFRISDPLLLRTSTHLIKSGMLWASDGLAEDAYAALLMALEGSVLMLQRSSGGKSDRVKPSLARSALKDRFEAGEYFADEIESMLGWGGHRAQLVHPQVSVNWGWKPSAMAEDFYETHRLVRLLLLNVVTGLGFSDERADHYYRLSRE